MSYTIKLTNGTVLAVIPDGTMNNQTSMSLIGENYVGYGQFLDDNFVYLLENSANDTPPLAPLTGQLWWDSVNSLLKVYNGRNFTIINNSYSSETPPINPVAGELWYDSSSGVLNVYSGLAWITVGPNINDGTGTIAAVIVDSVGANHNVVEILVGTNIVGIVSKDPTFTPLDPIQGFTTINPGYNVANSINGVPQYFQGTATNALTLQGYDPGTFMSSVTDTSTTGTLSVLNNQGISIGYNSNLSLFTQLNDGVILNNTLSGNLSINLNNSNTQSNVAVFYGANGSASFANGVSANYFIGDGSQLTGLPDSYANSNVANYLPTYTGNITANYFIGNGSQLTGLPASYANSNVASYLPTDPTIIGINGNISNLSSSLTNTNSNVTTLQGQVYANSNVANYLPTYNGNISVDTISTSNLSITSNTISTSTDILVLDPLNDESPFTGNVSVLGNLSVTGNLTYVNVSTAVTSNLLWIAANGSSNTAATGGGLAVGNVGDFAATFTYTNISNVWDSSLGITTPGDVTANSFIGDGSQLTGLPIGNYSNANVANYLPTNASNVSANYFIGNGSQLSGLPIGNYSNANVANYLPTYSGNISAANISANYFIGNGSQLTGLPSFNANAISYQQGSTGSVSRTVQSKLQESVSVLDFGADPTGTNSSQTAFQNAFNTGKSIYIPKGTYKITGQLNLTQPGQMIHGDGRTASVIVAQPGFTGIGVIVAQPQPGLEIAPMLMNFGITCVQPNTNVRANLNTYPPALYMVNISRFIVENLRISLFQYGINMTGNSGGAIINLLEMGCFTLGIQIDGSLDTVRINQLQYWPFDMIPGGTQDIFFQWTNVGMNIGRCDDLIVTSSLFINGGWHLLFQPGTDGNGVFGTVTGCAFDNTGSVSLSGVGNQVTFSNCYWTVGDFKDPSQRMVKVSQSMVFFSNCLFDDYSPNSQNIPYNIDISGGSAKTIFDGCNYRRVNVANLATFISITQGYLTVTGGLFDALATTYNNPWVSCGASASIVFVGNNFTTVGLSPYVGLSIRGDNYNVVTNNSFKSLTINTGGTVFSKSVLWPNSMTTNNYSPANVVSSRSFGNVYVNNSSAPLTVNSSFSSTVGDDIITAKINGSIIMGVTSLSFSNGVTNSSLTFVVPSYGNYQVLSSSSGSNSSIYSWVENN